MIKTIKNKEKMDKKVLVIVIGFFLMFSIFLVSASTISPSGGETLSGNILITWDIPNVDFYDIQISKDGGAFCIIRAFESNNEFMWDSTKQCLVTFSDNVIVKVRSSQDINTFIRSEKFTVDNTPQICPSVCTTLYEIVNNKCVLDTCGSGCGADGITTFDTLSECQEISGEEPIPEPTPPQPSAISIFINKILSWLKDLFSRIFPLAITGSQVVEPNTQVTYQIDLSAPVPDSDWSDGTYQVQYANWALVNSNGMIKQEGQWEEVFGSYNKIVTITTPSEIGDFALVGLITQFDMNFNQNTGIWETDEEQIINKEAIDLETKYTVEEPEVPIPSGFEKFINDLINFLKELWASIFG